MCNFLYNKYVYACVSKINDEANYIQQMLNVLKIFPFVFLFDLDLNS